MQIEFQIAVENEVSIRYLVDHNDSSVHTVILGSSSDPLLGQVLAANQACAEYPPFLIKVHSADYFPYHVRCFLF